MSHNVSPAATALLYQTRRRCQFKVKEICSCRSLLPIRPIKQGDWNAYLDNYEGVGPDFTLRILSRLVSDPRSFTIKELKTAFEAYLSAPQPGQDRKPHAAIEPANFSKAITGILAPTGVYVPTKGRPAQLYSMPPDILEKFKG